VSADMRTAFASTVTDLLAHDERVALVLAEISTDRLRHARKAFAERVVNVGIMEQTMIGVAAGFAMEGFHPVAHSLSPFVSERPYEQLKLDFGYQGLGGTFIGVGGSYDYSAEGASHHAPADVTLMLAIPGMEVLVPGHAGELETLLRATYADGRPTYLRASVATNDEEVPVAPGRIEVLRRGSLATVLAFGPMLSRTLRACEGLDVTLAYATSVRPFDASGLASAAAEATDVIVVEPSYEASTAPAVMPALAGRPARVTFVGAPRAFIHAYGTPAELDADLGLDEDGIRRRIAAALS
jgi:transketolase